MQVVVLAKQIPDPATPYRLEPDTHYLIRPNEQVLDARTDSGSASLGEVLGWSVAWLVMGALFAWIAWRFVGTGSFIAATFVLSGGFLPTHRRARWALAARGIAGLVLGTGLYLLLVDRLPAPWEEFLPLALGFLLAGVVYVGVTRLPDSAG